MLNWNARRQVSVQTPAVQISVAIAVGVALGSGSLLLSPVLVLSALIGAAATIMALKRPEFLLLGILVFSSTIMDEASVPVFNALVVNLYVTDLFLLISFALIIIRALAEPDFRLVSTPLDALLLGFFGVAIVTTALGLVAGVEREFAISEVRIVTYYLTFFAVTNLVRDEARLRTLIYGLFALAVFAASAIIVQFAVGTSVQILPGRVEQLVTTGEVHSEITRVVSVGEGLALTAFITMMAVAFFHRFTLKTSFGFLLTCWVGLAVVITFNRNFWIAVLLAVALMLYLVRGYQRIRILGWLGVGGMLLVIALLSIFSLPGGNRAQTLATASLERMFSLVDEENYDTTDESTLRWRDFEYQYALPAILENPLTGIGLGAVYRPALDGIDGFRFNGQHYVHNAHVWIMMKVGLPGYGLFMALSAVFVGRGLWYWPRIASPLLRGTVLGFTLTYLGVIVGAIVNPMFMQWYWTPIIGIMMGTNEVILRNFVQQTHEGTG